MPGNCENKCVKSARVLLLALCLTGGLPHRMESLEALALEELPVTPSAASPSGPINPASDMP